ncbi:LytTR family DNA-binding domain-containing protein [Saliterribacillus persicus]|uniref:LytTR family transcriptional regulator n=1 Tax=Saliterribacillus persicus TaxID=930114 RepID=A0A368XYW4_9BACI|nr:LytTR family DNA-binding domain-containing protein [Saliterribacillus persicus]RCW73055.1 LytTR family transcriptional regulator [Saliterribacillus persicus]
MKLSIDIDSKYDEIQITIHANEWTKEVEDLISKLEKKTPKRIVGMDGDNSVLLSPNDIEYCYAQRRKVYAVVGQQALEISKKLYELEDLLVPYGFSRFSKSVIGNTSKISRFELSFNGNLCVYFSSGNKEYVSRKYVSSLKNKLILGAEEDEV